MILAEALLGAETGQGVSYSRRKVYYSGGKRYRSRAYTYATVLASVAELVQNGWLFEHRVERLAIVVLGDAGTAALRPRDNFDADLIGTSSSLPCISSMAR